MKKIKELVIATHNKGKVEEISNLLSPYVDRFYSSGELGLSEPVEDGATFEENAIIKAKSAAQESGKIVLADDSGLSVTVLGGAPGVHSARWAGEHKDFAAAMARLNDELGDMQDRSAAFFCVLALAFPEDDTVSHSLNEMLYQGHDGVPAREREACVASERLKRCNIKTFEGKVEGEIVYPARGEKGFGFDPVFQPLGFDLTFAEMALSEKQKISHRARAFQKLIEGVFH